MAKNIFISYAAEDKVYLKEVKQLLREQQIMKDNDYSISDPLQVSIGAGRDIRKSLKKQIQSANVVVVLATDKSESSPWVNYEAGMADALNKQIIVVHPHGSEKKTLRSNLSKFLTLELRGKAKDACPKLPNSSLGMKLRYKSGFPAKCKKI